MVLLILPGSQTRNLRLCVLLCSPAGEGNGNPLQLFLPRESCGQRSLGAAVHRVTQSRTWLKRLQFSSDQFSRSVMSDSVQPHESQHARPPCPSPVPGVHSESCPLSWWCHPAISPSVVPFSSCLQSFPASESFPMRQFFASGGQSFGVSASASVLPMNIQK